MSEYDTALFDLDGVVYLGPDPIPGAVQGLAELRARGTQIGFVTNNAARTPDTVVAHLQSLGIKASLDDVVTSAQASARQLATELPAGSLVYVCGTSALADEVAKVGLTPVSTIDPQPVAVVQGYDPEMSQPRLDEAGFAIQRGARWFVTNTDQTRPTDRGLVPGAGTQVLAVRATVASDPIVAGKPYPPLLRETLRRLGSTRPIFVGDRLDTDILGACTIGVDSLFVFTGAHGKHDLADASPDRRPTSIGWDLAALLAPRREATRTGESASSGAQSARVHEGEVRLLTTPTTRDDQLDALWAVLALAWATGAAPRRALDALTLIP